MNTAPIVLFAYNRLHQLTETVQALQKNDLASDSMLYIFSDGAKNERDAEDVRKVREYLRTISGFGKVELRLAPVNKGLANSVIAGISEIVNQYGRIIVLEDDLVTSPYFLRYMNDALEFYRDDDRVASVSGYSYPLKGIQEDTFFLTGTECWAWGTWKRAWKLFEPDVEKLLLSIKANPDRKKLIVPRGFRLYDLLCAQRDGYVSSWAVRWEYSVLLANKLTLYPARTLISNIGSGTGTHCTKIFFTREDVSSKRISVSTIPVENNAKLAVEYATCMKQLHKESILTKLKRYLKCVIPNSVLKVYRTRRKCK